MRIGVIIPAFNEEKAIARVIEDIPKGGVADDIVVVNNNSYDRTGFEAEDAGAVVIDEENEGYGYACTKGINYFKETAQNKPDIIVFMDGDYSYYPEEIIRLITPIMENECDMVSGSRILGERTGGAIYLHEKLAVWLISRALNRKFNTGYTDISHFMAIKFKKLQQLQLHEQTNGWSTEVFIKAIQAGIKIKEVPVSYRQRIGKSKISGNVFGLIASTVKSLSIISTFKKQ